METVLQQLELRFSEHNKKVFALQGLYIPEKMDSVSREVLMDAVSKYESFLDVNLNQFENELHRWENSWFAREPKPSTVIDSLNACEKQFYPNIHILLRIFAVLPVTTASGERGFSAMKRVRPWIRSSMEQDRFTGLSHINIHRDIAIPTKVIVQKFITDASRRAYFGP